MILSLTSFRDKLAGCWAGKNIGGVLGAPFEGYRQINKADFYTQDLSMGPPPNDDLDLQIVWLAAVEKYGRNVNAAILGEYWLSYVIPNWVEYGTGKSNLRAGLMPPLSGEVNNGYKNSCGCFIRSELWACLAPGHPEIAARYAYEDAIVDHAGEGMYGEIFFAALESAAFVESDTRKLLEIGLSYIPSDCVTAKAIGMAVACYDQKTPFEEARKRIHNVAPGTFGVLIWKVSEVPTAGNEGMAFGEPGFDAPENVAFAIAGWLYGEGDFGRSLCLANACGEDTDCTCATLGAIYGIVRGESGLPEKWKKPLDDRIVTMCIDNTSKALWIPKTAAELAERILRIVPGFLGPDLCDPFACGGMQIRCSENELRCPRHRDYLTGIDGERKGGAKALTIPELCALSPYVVRYEFPAFQALIDYRGSAFFQRGVNRSIGVKLLDSGAMNQQQWARISVYLPQGAGTVGASCVELPLNTVVGACAETTFEITTEQFSGGKLELMVDISLVGRHSSGAIKVTLLCNG